MVFDQETNDALRELVRDELRIAVDNSIALVQEGEDTSSHLTGALYTLESLHHALTLTETLKDMTTKAVDKALTSMEFGDLPTAVTQLRDLADRVERYDASTSPMQVFDAAGKKEGQEVADDWQALTEEDTSLAPQADDHPEPRRLEAARPPGPRSIPEAGEAGESRGRGGGDDSVDGEPPRWQSPDGG